VFQAELCELQAQGEELRASLGEQGGELGRVKEEQAEQTRLLKRLQRKLQLVTAERDSYKVCDSTYVLIVFKLVLISKRIQVFPDKSLRSFFSKKKTLSIFCYKLLQRP